jgi:RIO kinase 1
MRIGKEKFKVWGDVFDEFTRQNIIKLISQHYFDGLESPISIGKEANLFTALRDNTRVIVKIYRLETCDFNRMYDYIKYDPRYVNLRGKRRKIIINWVEREYRNLLKAREIGIPVPIPMTYLNNVLVLEFIGDDDIAPRLKDLKPKNPNEFFYKIVDSIKKLYRGGYVHSDISAFNILNYNENPVFIDFSQCTPLQNPRSSEFLLRDIKNISSFFRKIGINTDDRKVMNYVMGKEKNFQLSI